MAIGIVEGTIEPGSEQFNILVLSASVLNYYYYYYTTYPYRLTTRKKKGWSYKKVPFKYIRNMKNKYQ